LPDFASPLFNRRRIELLQALEGLKFFGGSLAIAEVLIHLCQAEVRIGEGCIRSRSFFVGSFRTGPIATLRFEGAQLQIGFGELGVDSPGFFKQSFGLLLALLWSTRFEYRDRLIEICMRVSRLFSHEPGHSFFHTPKRLGRCLRHLPEEQVRLRIRRI